MAVSSPVSPKRKAAWRKSSPTSPATSVSVNDARRACGVPSPGGATQPCEQEAPVLRDELEGPRQRTGLGAPGLARRGALVGGRPGATGGGREDRRRPLALARLEPKPDALELVRGDARSRVPARPRSSSRDRRASDPSRSSRRALASRVRSASSVWSRAVTSERGDRPARSSPSGWSPGVAVTETAGSFPGTGSGRPRGLGPGREPGEDEEAGARGRRARPREREQPPAASPRARARSARVPEKSVTSGTRAAQTSASAASTATLAENSLVQGAISRAARKPTAIA